MVRMRALGHIAFFFLFGTTREARAGFSTPRSGSRIDNAASRDNFRDSN